MKKISRLIAIAILVSPTASIAAMIGPNPEKTPRAPKLKPATPPGNILNQVIDDQILLPIVKAPSGEELPHHAPEGINIRSILDFLKNSNE